MNKVIISGKVAEWTLVNLDIGIFSIEEKDLNLKRSFYVFYEHQLFPFLDVKIKDKNVMLIGTLEHIRVKLPSKNQKRRMVAIKLDDIEVLSDDL